LNEYCQTNVTSPLTNIQANTGGDYHIVALLGYQPRHTRAAQVTPSVSTNGFSDSLPTQSGRVYRLEYKASLEETNWSALPLVAGKAGMLTLVDPTATNSGRLYRVRHW
jgi:hypothetical protein